MFCPYCGKLISHGSRICPQCGGLIPFSAAPPAVPSAGARTEDQVPVHGPVYGDEYDPHQRPARGRARMKETGPRGAFPEKFSATWAFGAAFGAAAAIDMLLLRNHRGVNALAAGLALFLMWAAPLLRARSAAGLPALPSLLFSAMTIAMFFQSDGPADNALYPFWFACLIYFGAACRNRLLGLEGKSIDSVFDRTVPLSQASRDALRGSTETPGRRTRAGQLLLGLAASIPIAAIVLHLMSSADKGFQIALDNVFKNLDKVWSHLFWIAAIGVVLFLWAGLLAMAKERARAEKPARPAEEFPLLSSTVVLCVLALITGCFLFVHMQTLMLAEDRIVALTGELFYQYIRRGFAELLGVEAIIGVTLLAVLHSAAWKRDAAPANRIIAWALIAFTAGLAVSCASRLAYYVDEYGITLVRSLNTVGVALSFACLVFLAVRVVRPVSIERSAAFIAKMFLAFFVLWSCSMPVRVISAINSAKYLGGRDVELKYLQYLGPDAWPALADVLSRGPAVMLGRDKYKDFSPWIQKQEQELAGRTPVEWSPSATAALNSLRALNEKSE